ncbi:YegS/Rv2252/BmrU family lipid kinase, partial [Paenibacillus sepulcri]|nr:YegS/Rv2252/BmrU family lipid kinase [Paenibacillus sepulcri]
SCHATESEGDATIAASEAADRGFDMIIAAGGDGTLYEVINGLATKESRPPLGILPLGTTNDFARGLGIPKQWESACDLIIQQFKRPIDLGKANERYFINIAGGGSLTELTYEVPSKLKTMIGQLAYYMKGLEKMTRLRPTELILQADEIGEMHEEIMLFLICNSNSVGGFEKLAPDATIDDGLLDVIVLKKCNLGEFIRIASLALRGEHLHDPHVVHFQTRALQVTTPDYIQLNLDGEYGGTLPCTFNILPSHLEIFVDEEGNTTYK